MSIRVEVKSKRVRSRDRKLASACIGSAPASWTSPMLQVYRRAILVSVTNRTPRSTGCGPAATTYSSVSVVTNDNRPQDYKSNKIIKLQ